MIVVVTVAALAATPEEMLKRADAPREAFPEAMIKVHLTVSEKGRSAVEQDFDLYVKGTDRALCVFRGGKQSGRKILTSGDRVWLIVPGASNAIPVSANQRLLGGASFGDVARLRFAEDFRATLREQEEVVNGTRCRLLELAAKTQKTPYAAGLLWVGTGDGLPRRIRLRLASGKEAKEADFLSYGSQHSRMVLKKMRIRDLLAPEKDVTTLLEYLDYRPARLDTRIFEPEGAKGL